MDPGATDRLSWTPLTGVDTDELAALLHRVPCPFAANLPIQAWRLCEDDPAAPAAVAVSPLTTDELTVVVELPPRYATTGAALRDATIRLLGGVAEAPPGRAGPFLDPEGWWIRAGGNEWFVTVHASLYPTDHSRYWPRDGAVVVLIPRQLFDRLVPAGIAAGVRRSVRAAFTRAGQRYPAVPGAIAIEPTR